MSAEPIQAMLDPEWLEANDWNPNRMNAFMYAKELGSIRDHGMIDPITVRKLGSNRYQIIDGEHRWRACRDLGLRRVPVVIVDVGDADARKLTIVLNELRGQILPAEMGILLKDLLKEQDLDSLLEELPYTEEMFRGLTELPPLEPLTDDKLSSDPSIDEKRWVERLYRLPLAAAKVVDDAIERAKDGDEIENWQALERLAAEFLAS